MGGPAKHPLSAPINPFYTFLGLRPALSPSLQAFPPSRGCWGEGRKFPGSEASRALPQSSEPLPSAQLPADRLPDRGCPALGTRSSSESVASSSFAFLPLSLFSSRGPRPLPHPCSFQERRPMLRSLVTRGPRFCQSPRTDPAPFGPAVQPPPPFPGPAVRRTAPSRGPRCAPRAPRGAPAARWLCRSRSALGAPLGSSGAALAQMCWGPARAPVPSANFPDQTAPPAPSWRAPWRTPLAAPNPSAAPCAAPARLERSGLPSSQAAPAASSLLQAAAAAAAAGTVSPAGTFGVNSSPAGLQPGDPGQKRLDGAGKGIGDAGGRERVVAWG